MPPPRAEGDSPELHLEVLIGTLQRHNVEFLVVGGVAAQGYGATRVTKDLDCVVRQQRENLDRLANALRELGARLRVGGLSDDEAKLLPFQLDGASLAGGQTWTLRTDAGDLDMLANILGKGGTRLDYEALAERAGVVQLESLIILVASLDDVIVSKQVADRQKDHGALPELLEIAGGTAPTIGRLVEDAHPSLPEPAIPPGPNRDGPSHYREGPEPGPRGPQAEIG